MREVKGKVMKQGTRVKYDPEKEILESESGGSEQKSAKLSYRISKGA